MPCCRYLQYFLYIFFNLGYNKILYLQDRRMNKKEIREKTLRLRGEMPPEARRHAGREIEKKLTGLIEFRQADTILIYADFNSEVETGEIIRSAWKAGKTVGLPRVEGSSIRFYSVADFSEIKPGHWNIMEPDERCAEIAEADLAIMPGVAFDEALHRIGYGGGFYDRYLADKKMVKAAIAFEMQIYKEIPHDGNDISPDILVTEEKIRRKKSGKP